MSRIAASTLALAALALVTGCDNGTDDTDSVTPPEPEVGTASLRVLHMSPDAPAVDVYVGGSAAISGLDFHASSQFLEVDAGTYDLQVSPAGTSASDAVLEVQDVSLSEDAAYTAVAWDAVASIKALLLEEDLSEPAAGEIRVRAVHAAPAVGEVDIWEISDPSAPVALFEDLDLGEASASLDLPAGAYRLGVDVDDDQVPDVSFSLPSLEEGTIANVFAHSVAGGDVHLLAQLQDGTTARIDMDQPEPEPASIRVVHLSRDAGPVDVWADGAPAITDLGFAEGTGWIDLDAGAWTFDVVPAGGMLSDSVLTVADLELPSMSTSTVVAYGDVAGLSAMALADDDSDLGMDEIRVRAIHAAPTVGQVDIWEVSDPSSPLALYEDVDFGVAGDWLDLPAGAYTLGFDVDDDASPDVVFELPSLEAGTVANVFAATDADGAVHLQAQLWDGTLVRIDAR